MFNYILSFYGLISLQDISEWDTKNVTNMNAMFYNCTSLKSLPEMSNCDKKNFTKKNYMFYHCSSLKSLPDILNGTHKMLII